ncbi:MAG: glycosyltransferase [Prevotella sp.]|nr:glycosyltransferase [Prevotella sp.]
MIFSRDKSQMCNNLLQFAHVYAWAREHNRSVMSMRFSYKYKGFFKIDGTNLVSFPLYLMAKYAAALHILPTASFKRRDCDHAALEQMMLRHRHIVVSGWFVRFYDLFEKYKPEICDLFTVNERYAAPVRQRMAECEQASGKDVLRLGVHIRRGDYKEWANGAYYYDDGVYAEHIQKFTTMFPGKECHVYLSTNDPAVRPKNFRLSPDTDKLRIHLLRGNAIEDLYMLSQCDYIIGPPSTYSLVASMYRDVPFYRMDKKDVELFRLESFNTFNYWFRRINDL